MEDFIGRAIMLILVGLVVFGIYVLSHGREAQEEVQTKQDALPAEITAVLTHFFDLRRKNILGLVNRGDPLLPVHQVGQLQDVSLNEAGGPKGLNRALGSDVCSRRFRHVQDDRPRSAPSLEILTAHARFPTVLPYKSDQEVTVQQALFGTTTMLMDIFNNNAFQPNTMMRAIDRVGYTPQLLGGMGIFDPVPISTLDAYIEERGSEPALINEGKHNDDRLQTRSAGTD